MKSRVHPAVAIVVIVVVVAGAGFLLSKAFTSGVVGKTYAPGEEPFVNKNLDTEPDAIARDAARNGDPDGK